MKERSPAIYIRPTLAGISILDFDKIEEVWRQAQPAMDELRSKLDQLLDTR